ncbi:MAG: hypothetical protein M3N32_08030 [Actinomycetota bacterium]|nr:hypothetical protein [Actinomycetota bacterium]
MAKKNEQAQQTDEPTVQATAPDAVVETQDASVQAVRDAAPRAVDRVALVSLNADLTPAQTEGFEVVGDRDLARQDVQERLRTQRVSYADDSARRALAGVTPGTVGESPGEDPIIKALRDKQEDAVGDVEGDARNLVPEK